MELDGFVNNPMSTPPFQYSATRYFGGTDVSIEEFRSRRWMWQYGQVARTLLTKIPFWTNECMPRDALIVGEYNGGSGQTGPLVDPNGGAYGIGSFGQAQVLAYEFGGNPPSDARYLIYFPEAYSVPAGQRTSTLATLRALGQLDVPYATTGLPFLIQYFSPIDGSAVGDTILIDSVSAGQIPLEAPKVSDWVGGASPDVVCLIVLNN